MYLWIGNVIADYQWNNKVSGGFAVRFDPDERRATLLAHVSVVKDTHTILFLIDCYESNHAAG